MREPANGLADRRLTSSAVHPTLRTDQIERVSRLAEALADLRGWDVPLQDIRRRLRRQQCRATLNGVARTEK